MMAARRGMCFLLGLFCVACAATRGAAPGDPCTAPAESLAERVASAHGGLQAWQALKTLYVEREHRFANGTELVFDIHAEYATGRIYQQWRSPAGVLAWDGERAWSSGWALAETFLPRFTAGIGFPLVNLPWLARLAPPGSLENLGCLDAPEALGPGRFVVLRLAHEPDPIRKPAWFDGPRNAYELWIDTGTWRLRGVMQHWTYAGQLDLAGLPLSASELTQLFVPEKLVQARGLLWPGTYSAYAPSGALAASGRFHGYDFKRAFDAGRLVPPEDNASFDTSSSYLRTP